MVRILGIDPGSVITGYGIIESEHNHNQYIKHGCIMLKGSLPEKLKTIHEEIRDIISEYQPHEAAIEKVFMHRNADSALKLGQARGVAIAACAIYDLPVYEYSANQVKQATVGKGHAVKQQVQHMVKILLCLQLEISQDEADALAVSICHAHSREGKKRMQHVSGIRHSRLR